MHVVRNVVFLLHISLFMPTPAHFDPHIEFNCFSELELSG